MELGGRVVSVGLRSTSPEREVLGSIPGRTPQKIARPQDSHVVTCPAGGPGKTRLTRPSVAELYPGNIEILA